MSLYDYPYRVRFKGEHEEICVIEGEAPIDCERMRAFVRKTRRVFNLADDADIRVIELRMVPGRRDVTKAILEQETESLEFGQVNSISALLDLRDHGGMCAMDTYREARKAFDWGDDDLAS